MDRNNGALAIHIYIDWKEKEKRKKKKTRYEKFLGLTDVGGNGSLDFWFMFHFTYPLFWV